MNWTELLKAEIQSTYATTDKLIGLVDDNALQWKPSTGTNWMTTGQLLKHLTEGCGGAFRAFVTGDWGLPPGTDPSALTQLPSAEKLPAIESVAEARRLLEEDKRVAVETLATCDEEKLAHAPAPAPWDQTDMILGRRLLQMVEHMKQHKGQLFYYLKLQGKPVNTADLWGV
jgi:uncharacterized damage-inducible protein DinB